MDEIRHKILVACVFLMVAQHVIAIIAILQKLILNPDYGATVMIFAMMVAEDSALRRRRSNPFGCMTEVMFCKQSLVSMLFGYIIQATYKVTS